MKHVPVDDKVKKSVTAGADLVQDQADADPHAGIGQRAAMGVSKCQQGLGIGLGLGQALMQG